jgi:hypothetical protein
MQWPPQPPFQLSLRQNPKTAHGVLGSQNCRPKLNRSVISAKCHWRTWRPRSFTDHCKVDEILRRTSVELAGWLGECGWPPPDSILLAAAPDQPMTPQPITRTGSPAPSIGPGAPEYLFWPGAFAQLPLSLHANASGGLIIRVPVNNTAEIRPILDMHLLGCTASLLLLQGKATRIACGAKCVIGSPGGCFRLGVAQSVGWASRSQSHGVPRRATRR